MWIYYIIAWISLIVLLITGENENFFKMGSWIEQIPQNVNSPSVLIH